MTPPPPSFLSAIRATRQTLADGEQLFAPGDAVTALYRVDQGAVRLTQGGVCQHVAQAGHLFGEAGMFGPVHTSTAQASGPTIMTLWSKAAIILHLRAHADLALGFAAWMAGRLDACRAEAQILRQKSAADRVLDFLTLAGAAQATITLDRPLIVLAPELGLTHEALYRTIKTLTDQGRIHRTGKRGFRIIGPGYTARHPK